MTNIIVYTDFDGTITNRVGSQTVFSPFYQSLLVGYVPDVEQDYKHTELKPKEELQQLFAEKFGLFDENFDYSTNDSDILMSAKAVSFLHALLKKEEVSINIVTKNRIDYIQTLLRYQGFTEEEISKIKIQDSGYKYNDVSKSLLDLNHQGASALYILDDDARDYAAMIQAAIVNGYEPEQIRGYNQAPGTFNWDTYQEEILAHEALQANNDEVQEGIEAPSFETSTSVASSDNASTAPLTFQINQEDCEASNATDINFPLTADLQQSSPQHESFIDTRPFVNIIDEEQPISDDYADEGLYAENKTTPTVTTVEKPEIVDVSPYRNTTITAASAGVGFTIGFTAGLILVATGVFAPFGLGLIGALTLGLTLGASTGLVAGLGGCITAIGTDPRIITQASNKTDATLTAPHNGAMSGLGGKVSQKTVSEAPVEHFATIFANEKQVSSPKETLTDTSNYAANSTR